MGKLFFGLPLRGTILCQMTTEAQLNLLLLHLSNDLVGASWNIHHMASEELIPVAKRMQLFGKLESDGYIEIIHGAHNQQFAKLTDNGRSWILQGGYKSTGKSFREWIKEPTHYVPTALAILAIIVSAVMAILSK